MLSLTRTQALGFILLFGFCARGITYRLPLLDHHAWRQADTAAISRNFARESLNPLRPQVDWREARPSGEVETGFELFALVVAMVSRLTGRFQPEIGRVLGAVLFVLSGLLIEAFTRRRYGEQPGLIAVFVYAFGFPLALFMDRAFMNEPLLICLSIACLRVTQRYLDDGRTTTLVQLVVASALIGAIKLPFLIIWAPIIGLFVERDGIWALRRPSLLIVLAADLLAAGAWYFHAHRLGQESGLSFSMTDKLFDAALVFSPAFVVQIGRQLFKDLFGLTLIFFAVGLADAVRHRRLCELSAVAGFAAYLVIVARGNYIHDYYQLPIVVIAPVVAAIGIVRSTPWLAAKTGRREASVLAVTLAALVASTLVRSVSAHSWYEINADTAQVCEQSGTFLRRDDRLLFVDYNDPQLLFCMDRKGWLLTPERSTEAQLTDAAASGATVAIVWRVNAGTPAAAWVAAHGAPIFENPALIVYRLRR